jgi:hypothetical protein
MDKINVGDVVTLRSGGLRMTVTRLPDGEGKVLVAYTAPEETGFGRGLLGGGGETIKQIVFPIACLVVVDKLVQSEEKT